MTLPQSAPRPRPWLRVWIVAPLATILLAACTGEQADPPSSPVGDKAVLCKFDSDFHQAAKCIQTKEDSVAVIKSFEPRFDEALQAAPAEVRPAADTLIEGLRAIIQQNDLDPAESAEAFSTAGKRIDAYCGVAN